MFVVGTGLCLGLQLLDLLQAVVDRRFDAVLPVALDLGVYQVVHCGGLLLEAAQPMRDGAFGLTLQLELALLLLVL